jgi:hypothetical protein
MVYARTAYNRSVYASGAVAPSGFRYARSATPPTLRSTHSFAGLQTCGLLIRPAKPSYTAGTLDEIKTENIRIMRRIRAAQEEYF